MEFFSIWTFILCCFSLSFLLSIIFALNSADSLPGCGPASSCDAVTSSRWSRLGPFPVSALGTCLYLLMLTAALATRIIPSLSAPAILLLAFAAPLALGSALWFTILQLFVIRKICLYCTLTHLAAAIASLLILTDLPPNPSLPLVTGTTLSLRFIILQMLIRPTLYRLTPASDLRTEAMPTANVPVQSAASLSAPNSAPQSETLTLLNSRITLTRSGWPLLGSPTAPRTIALLFDVTCTECRELYRTVLQATRQDPALAALAIPIPMHPACNPTVCKTSNPNPEACDHARLFLALWHTDQVIYHQYVTWLLGRSVLPSLFESRSQANKLLGSSRLTLALTAPSLDTRLRAAVDIYTQLKPDKLPQLLLPHGIAQGKITSADLAKLLKQGSAEQLATPASTP